MPAEHAQATRDRGTDGRRIKLLSFCSARFDDILRRSGDPYRALCLCGFSHSSTQGKPGAAPGRRPTRSVRCAPVLELPLAVTARLMLPA
jgi:hypothetical protein